jgi:hypothetical protein
MFCLTDMTATLVGALALRSAAFVAIPTCALIWSVIVLGSELGIRSSWGRVVGVFAVFLGGVGVLLGAGAEGKRVVDAGVPVQGWADVEAGGGVVAGAGGLDLI